MFLGLLNDKSNHRTLIIGFTLLLRLAGAVSSILVIQVLNHQLGLQVAGKLLYLIAAIQLISVVGRLGTDVAIVRVIAKNNESSLAQSVIATGLLVFLLPLLLLLAALLFGVVWWALSLSVLVSLKDGLLLTILVCSHYFLVQLHTGLRHPILASILTTLIPSMIFLLGLRMTDTSSYIAAANLYMFSFLFSVAASSLSLLVRGIKFRPRRCKRLWRTNLDSFKEVVSSAKKMSLVTFCRQSILWGGQLTLGFAGNEEGVTILAFCQRVANAVGGILTTVNAYAAPHIASLWWSGAIAELKTEVASNLRFLSVLGGGALTALFIVFSFDSAYSIFSMPVSSKFVMLTLLFAQAFNLVSGSVGNLLSMSSNEHVILITHGIALTLGATLIAVVGVNNLDAFGVSIIYASISAVVAALGSFGVRSRLGFFPAALLLQKN